MWRLVGCGPGTSWPAFSDLVELRPSLHVSVVRAAAVSDLASAANAAGGGLILALAANVVLNRRLSPDGDRCRPWALPESLAASIIYILLCAGLVAYIAMVAPFRDSQPFRRIWVMDWGVTVRLLRIGVPIGLTIVAEAGMFIAVTFIIGLFGTAALAAAAIANQIAAVTFMIPSLSRRAAPFASAITPGPATG